MPPSMARLAAASASGRRSGDLGREPRRRLRQQPGGDHLRDEPQRVGARRARRAGRSGSAPWRPRRPTTRASRCVPPAPGMMPSRTSVQPDLGAVGGDAQVAGERQLQPAAERGAVDRRDRPAAGTPRPRSSSRLSASRKPQVSLERHRAPLLEIGARAERLAPPRRSARPPAGRRPPSRRRRARRTPARAPRPAPSTARSPPRAGSASRTRRARAVRPAPAGTRPRPRSPCSSTVSRHPWDALSRSWRARRLRARGRRRRRGSTSTGPRDRRRVEASRAQSTSRSRSTPVRTPIPSSM